VDNPVYRRLLEKGLTHRVNAWGRSFDGKALTVFDLYTGREEVVEGVDTLVLATGPRANDELYFQLKGKVEHLHRIGDCVAPRRLDHAIYEGYLAGRELWSPEDRYIVDQELESWSEAEVSAPT
jgi:hypothetical protein